MKPLYVAPLALAAVLTASAVQAERPGETNAASFRDWRVACDNTRVCVAFGYAGEEAGGLGPFLRIERGARATDDPKVLVGLGVDDASEGAAAGQAAVLTIEGGRAPMRFAGVVAEDRESGLFRVELSDRSRQRAFTEALKDGSRLAVSVSGRSVGSVSLSGSSAALRWLDDRQGRAGGVTALVAKGPVAASAVPAAPAAPVIRLAAPVGQDGVPEALPPALARRADVKACAEENADDTGDFSEPQVARLSAREYLWGVPCGRGAYNYSYRYIIAGRDGSNARSPGLDGYDDTLVNGGYDPESRTLDAFSKGRGIGDCGDLSLWGWDGQRFRLIRRALMDECQGVPPDLWPTLFTARAVKEPDRAVPVGSVQEGARAMPKSLKTGDKVKWNTSQGETTGRVVRKATTPMKIKGHQVKASKENPEYVVKSDKTGVFRGAPDFVVEVLSPEGFRVDRIEHVLPRHPEFLLRDLDHLFLGHRRDVVLQHRELLDVLGRQEVRARRQHLPELRVGRAEFLERSSQPLGLPAPAGRTLLVGPAEQLLQAMFAHYRRDLRAPRHQPGLGERGLGASDHGRRFPRWAIADRERVYDDHGTAGVVADAVGDVAE